MSWFAGPIALNLLYQAQNTGLPSSQRRQLSLWRAALPLLPLPVNEALIALGEKTCYDGLRGEPNGQQTKKRTFGGIPEPAP